jgi:hypothetical protein
MSKITVLYNQSLQDIALQHCGTIEAMADIVKLNDLSWTPDLVPGQIIQIPSKDYGFQEVVNFFTLNKIQPANALTDEDKALIEGNSGIGFWEIENNFIVQ